MLNDQKNGARAIIANLRLARPAALSDDLLEPGGVLLVDSDHPLDQFLVVRPVNPLRTQLLFFRQPLEQLFTEICVHSLTCRHMIWRPDSSAQRFAQAAFRREPAFETEPELRVDKTPGR